MERSSWTLVPMHLALFAWLYFHFVVTGQALEINSLVTIYLLACLLLHRTVQRFTASLQEAIVSSWPIVIMYHLYAGVAGLIQFTSVGEYVSSLITPISTAYTFPLLTASISSVIAVFLPSSGTQWAIQGLVTVKTAVATGLSGQHGLLALSVGDQMGNLIAPFWAVVGAGIARVDFRQFFGYRLIFAVIWFVIGVLVFTFIPA
jgi:short-chain fatty acids transporter